MPTATLPRILADRLRGPPARRGWPVWAHYAATAALVLAAYAARLALDGIYHPPFLTFIPAVLAASLLLDRGSGLLATVLSAALAHRFLVHPGDGPGLGGGNAAVALAAFVVFGLFTAALIEAFRAAVDRLVEAERRARASEARTAALLDEMNHRFKNGLQAIGGVLHTQGRRMEDAAAPARRWRTRRGGCACSGACTTGCTCSVNARAARSRCGGSSTGFVPICGPPWPRGGRWRCAPAPTGSAWARRGRCRSG